MPFAAAVAAVGTVVASRSASSAANKAARAQQSSGDAAIDEQRRQFDLTQQSLQPFSQTGLDALNQQRSLLGLGALDPNAERRAELQSKIAAFGPQVDGTLPAGSAQFGPTDTTETHNQLLARQGGKFPMKNREKILELAAADTAAQEQEAEQNTLASLQAELAALAPPSDVSAQDQQQAAFAALEESPGQQFLRARAQRNLLRNSAAIGGLGGGNVRSALVQQGVGFAQQDLQNQFGRLGQIAGQGQAATTQVGQLGQQTAGNIGNALMAGGQARATGIQQQNQAFQQGLGGVATAAGQFFGGQGATGQPSQAGGGSAQFFQQNPSLSTQQLGVNTSAGSFGG